MVVKTITREESGGWEQLAFAEVLLPDTPNSYGDIYTRQAIREFAYQYAMRGYGLDIEHDKQDVRGVKYHVVESFIAREGDPDFVPGAWVVAIKVLDAEMWASILSGELNGFSFEAFVSMESVSITAPDYELRTGVTAADPNDGHQHAYVLTMLPNGTFVPGTTEEVNGHTHRILASPVTEITDGHNHRFYVT